MGHRRSIAGSRILITGASQGIGKALAEGAVARGARVLATARSAELLRELESSAKPAAGGAGLWAYSRFIPVRRRRRAGSPTMEGPGHAGVTPSSPVPLDRPPPPHRSLAMRPFPATRCDQDKGGFNAEDL